MPALNWQRFSKVQTVLRGLYPEAFKDRERRPLKVGIRSDILADPAFLASGISEQDLKYFFHWYAYSPYYIEALARGGFRIGLDGQPVGEIAPEARASAKQMVRAIRAKKRAAAAKKRAAEAEAAASAPEAADVNVATPAPEASTPKPPAAQPVKAPKSEAKAPKKAASAAKPSKKAVSKPKAGINSPDPTLKTRSGSRRLAC